MTELHLGPGVTFPADAVTQSFAVLAVRGAGKSSASVSMAEEMYAAGLPWVAIDPKGDWFGIRSSADGKHEGLPVPVFGGLHGDLPLEPEAGHLIADLIVDQNLTCVLDVSEFASKAAQVRFLTDLGDRLFRRHGKSPHPRHVFLEEADDVIPQRVMNTQAKCVGTWTKLVKQGRSRGLGITLISQRSAVVNKDALTQIETLIVMRTTSPQDRKAVLGWIDYHAVSKELVESLPSLKDGEAWVISPHWLGSIDKVRFRRRETFDSGATPTMGKNRQVATLADVDLDALRTEMSAVVERAEAADPKRLQARIRELERQLADRTQDIRIEYVDVPASIPPVIEELIITASAVADTLTGEAKRLVELAVVAGERLADEPVGAPRPAPPRRAAVTAARPPTPVDPIHLKRGAYKILDAAVRQHPVRLTWSQIAATSGYSIKSSTFDQYRRALLRNGYLVNDPDGLVSVTEDGIGASSVTPANPTSTAEVVDMWRGALKKGARTMLDVLIDAYPDGMEGQALAAKSGYSYTSSTFDQYQRTLVRNGLVTRDGDYYRADPILFP